MAICWAWFNVYCFIMKYCRHIKSIGTMNLVPTAQLKMENLIAFSFLSNPSTHLTPEFGAYHSLVCFYTFITYVHIYKWCTALFYMFSNFILLLHPICITLHFVFGQYSIFEIYPSWCLCLSFTHFRFSIVIIPLIDDITVLICFPGGRHLVWGNTRRITLPVY